MNRDITVRRLLPEELTDVMKLCLDTFMLFEAPDYPQEGIDTFHRDIIDNQQFHEDFRSGKNRCWGGFVDGTLAGVMCTRGESHITLVFTEQRFHRMGVGTAIFRQLIADVRAEQPELEHITLNSSPYGLPFYLHLGFVPTDTEQITNGIRFTPMVYHLTVK